MMSRTSFGSTVVAGFFLVSALAACGGGSGTPSATTTGATCSDYRRIVALDTSEAGGSAARYAQIRDLYQDLQKDAPESLHSDLKLLIDDEQQLTDNGTDSSSQNDAAQGAAHHVDAVLGSLCAGAAGSSAGSSSGGGDPSSPTSTRDRGPGLDECANLRKYAGEHNPVTDAQCPDDDGGGPGTTP